MSADTHNVDEFDLEGNGFSVPRLSGGVTDDGERYHVVWFRNGIRHLARFRVATCDRVATLQHIHYQRTSQRVDQRVNHVNADVTLDDLPHGAVLMMRADGFEPANEGERE